MVNTTGEARSGEVKTYSRVHSPNSEFLIGRVVGSVQSI